MRGFTDTKRAEKPVLGAAAYSKFITDQNRANYKTENATRWYRRPAYCIGERRKEYEEAICRESRDIQSGD